VAHMHYTGTGKMHSFRGLLTDVAGENQQRIRIQGATGDIAWRITKFQLMPDNPMTEDGEHVVKIYRERQTSIDGVIDFTNAELLGASIIANETDGKFYPININVIFDNTLFVRNIYLTHVDQHGSTSCNYYIELEEVKVSKAGMAQLAVAAARRNLPD